MRAFALAFAVVIAACSCEQSIGIGQSTPSPAASCKLPVYWAENTPETHTHAAFISVPSGVITDVGTIPTPANTFLFGATYDDASKRWLPEPRNVASPDHTQYAYQVIGISETQVHVVDIASLKDRVVYNGETPFEVIAFGSDGVYLAQAINPRQGVFAKLFRLDPAGGSPQLVRGSDRHMDPTGWTKVSGGAAWGLDFRVNGTVYTYQVERLDLATGMVTQWLQGGPERQWAPMGTDDAKRLYVTDGYEVWRLSRPGQVDTTIGGTQVAGALTFGTEVLADSNGAWFPGRGGVWLYSDALGLRELAAGPESEMVFPAGACT